MTATTKDGVEVQIEHDSADGRIYVRIIGAPRCGWRETDRTTVESAALWVSRLTWSEVRLSCL
jgi:hypothetical protein